MKTLVEQITIDDLKAGNLVPVDDTPTPASPSSDTFKPSNTQSGFEPIQMGLGGTTPADTSTDQTPAPSDLTPVSDTEETKSDKTDSSPTERELELFKKFHASNFDPNSSMDRKKLEQLRQAASEVGQNDDSKIQSAVYKKQYGNSTSAERSQPKIESEAEKRSRLLKPVNGMFIRTGFNQFRPAVQADLEAKTPLFMQNPNPVYRQFNPYVQVDRMAAKAKRAIPVTQKTKVR